LIDDHSHKFGNVGPIALLQLVLDSFEHEVEEWHGAGVAIGTVDVPLVPSEVVLVEELSSFGCLWQEALSFNDVPNQDLANIVAELLSV